MESKTKITYAIERECYNGKDTYEEIQGCYALKSLEEVEQLLEEFENVLKWTGEFIIFKHTEINGVKSEEIVRTILIEDEENEEE